MQELYSICSLLCDLYGNKSRKLIQTVSFSAGSRNITGVDGHFYSVERGAGDRTRLPFCFAKMYGIHQFLNWWMQHPTGVLHSDGFESGTITNKKRGGISLLFFVGAGDRTRTGTPSLAADFESATSTISSHRRCAYLV